MRRRFRKMCVEKLCKLCLTVGPSLYFSPPFVFRTLSLIQRSIGSGFVNWNSINITKTLAYALAIAFFFAFLLGCQRETRADSKKRTKNGQCRHFHIISPTCDPFLGPPLVFPRAKYILAYFMTRFVTKTKIFGNTKTFNCLIVLFLAFYCRRVGFYGANPARYFFFMT